MQLTINLNNLSTPKRLELFALLNLIDEAHPAQGILPMQEVVEEEVVVKPKQTRAKSPKPTPEDTKEVEVIPEPTQEVKTPSVGLSEIKALAQSLVVTHDRDTVKGVISKYGDKLSEVPESKYQELFDELSSLGA